jgi:hypothetical protein
MIFILISWLYILFSALNFGFWFDKVMKVNSENFIIKIIFGLFSITLLATLWAFFCRINIEFHLVLLTLNLIISNIFRKEVISEYLFFFSEFRLISKKIKFIVAITTILIIGQCATAPFLADNESYYIQTIKWLNEYGLVKGLANLHIFFGQNSGWHICQSVFNFSFLYKNFNDLSGFCLLIGNIFAFQKLDLYFKSHKINNLIIGLFPLFNLLFFRFISSPSPDIPVYVFSFIVFYIFIDCYKSICIENFKTILIFVLFILFIKATSIAIILIPVYLFFINFDKLKSGFFSFSVLIFSVFGLYVIKNLIISGYPFYPLPFFGFLNLDYAIPAKMLSFLTEATQADAYWLSAIQYSQIFN